MAECRASVPTGESRSSMDADLFPIPPVAGPQPVAKTNHKGDEEMLSSSVFRKGEKNVDFDR